ncbi:MAG: NAD(P)-dependent oxidoreductase [Chitinophagaceae bacterium]
MKIGFIGLGSLGTPIAMNILESGHELVVYNRTISKAKPLADKGAIVSTDIAGLAKQCDIIFTIVSDDAALKEITGGEEGMIQNMQPGSMHISMSTILPETAKEIASLHQQNKQEYLASPVFGRPEAAAVRKLNFAISGPEPTRKKAESILRDAGGMNVFHFGDSLTAANTVKLCGNFLIAGALQAIGESINLANASGVDAKEMWGMFLQTLFNAPVYHNYANIILNKKFEPAAFTAKLGLKDLKLVLQQGNSVNQSMPLAYLVKGNMEKLVNSGGADIDWSAVSTAVDKNV